MSDRAEMVSLSALVIDHRYQTRATTDESAIDEYADAIRQAGRWPFPPIKLVSQIVVDGFHRIEAVKRVLADNSIPPELRKALQEIPCERVTVDLATDDVPKLAMLHAIAANHTHGIRRTREDKRRSVKLALEQWPDKSSREIARITFTSNTFVSNLRSESCTEASSNELQASALTPRTKPEPLTAMLEVSTLTPSPESSTEKSGAKATLPTTDTPAADTKAKPPKDHWQDAIEALGVAAKRFVDCKTVYGIGEQEFRCVHQHFLNVDFDIARLKELHQNEKREDAMAD